MRAFSRREQGVGICSFALAFDIQAFDFQSMVPDSFQHCTTLGLRLKLISFPIAPRTSLSPPPEHPLESFQQSYSQYNKNNYALHKRQIRSLSSAQPRRSLSLHPVLYIVYRVSIIRPRRQTTDETRETKTRIPTRLDEARQGSARPAYEYIIHGVDRFRNPGHQHNLSRALGAWLSSSFSLFLSTGLLLPSPLSTLYACATPSNSTFSSVSIPFRLTLSSFPSFHSHPL